MQCFTLIAVYLTLHADDSLNLKGQTGLMKPVRVVTFDEGRLTRRRRSVGE